MLPQSLQDRFAITAFEQKGTLYSNERDVSKQWTKGAFNIACLGIENQSRIDKGMPLRVIGYDGAEYKRQSDENVAEPYPVVTLVLYFGRRQWRKPRSLFDVLKLDERLKPFVNDYRLNIFDVTHMSRKQAEKFSSDFKIIADYFAQVYETGKYLPSKQPIQHRVDLGRMLKYVTGNEKFDVLVDNEGGSRSMYDAFADAENRGEARGLSMGLSRGEAKLESYAKLTKKLIAAGRTADLERAADNAEFRQQLLKEFALLQ